MEIELDVSALDPPAPLGLTLDAAERLEAGEFLHMRHRRHPWLLYDNLTERGFESLTLTRDGCVEVYIWRCDDESAGLEARLAFSRRS